jgi:16S rRNA (cytidine1402-2'-O)-methyltransferase
MSNARLYVVATPIGNLEDITLRALGVLAEVDLIAAEDTRRSLKLLARHGLDRPLIALHEHNEEQQATRLVERLSGGESIALVSDAGTPLLSDPGYRLVRQCVQAGIPVVPVPGPSAITAALSVSGLPTDRFSFEGFLPPKQSARIKRLKSLRTESRTMVFFESSHRIQASLADLEEVFGSDRSIALCREISKQFETILRGTLSKIRNQVETDANQRKGEFVLVVSGCEAITADNFPQALVLAHELQQHLGGSQAARIAARIHGVPRRELYAALESGSESGSE